MKLIARSMLCILAVSVFSASVIAQTEKSVAGTYKVVMNLPDNQKNNAMAKQMMDAMKASRLVLKSNKTFTLNLMVNIEGTWSMTGHKVSLQALKMNGESFKDLKKKNPKMSDRSNKPMILLIDPKGRLTPEDSKPGRGTTYFVKA